jgi:hypothetical protein
MTAVEVCPARVRGECPMYPGSPEQERRRARDEAATAAARERRIRELVQRSVPPDATGGAKDFMRVAIDGYLDDRWLPIDVVRQLQEEGWIR